MFKKLNVKDNDYRKIFFSKIIVKEYGTECYHWFLKDKFEVL